MKKRKTPIQYDYLVHSITEDDTPAYKAIIPAFDNAIVYGDSLPELEDGIRFAIESEIAERKKEKRPIPKPEKKTKFNGKILIRVTPFLHEKIAIEARAAEMSINKYLEKRLKH